MKPFKEAEGYLHDLQAAYDYYRAYSPQTAHRFIAAYEAAERTLVHHPHICRPRRHGWRQMVIRRYPNYPVFYKELPDFWLLGGLVSTNSDPDAIQARLLIREVIEASEDSR
jgi:plasmid stabilization system protein ParE